MRTALLKRKSRQLTPQRLILQDKMEERVNLKNPKNQFLH